MNSNNIFSYNEKYFRHSKYPAINIIDFHDFYNDNNNMILPNTITNSAREVILNFFSILREANQGAALHVGCGSIGNGIVTHINLIAIVPLYHTDSKTHSYF